MQELQQTLLKNDCYLPGFTNEDLQDLARSAAISATSETINGAAGNVINGVSRAVGQQSNCWISESLAKPQTLSIRLEKAAAVHQLRLTFDTDLSHEIQPSIVRNVRERQVKGLPVELIKDYSVSLLHNGKVIIEREVKDNGQRLNVIDFVPGQLCDTVQIAVHKTHGCDQARIFEVRVY